MNKEEIFVGAKVYLLRIEPSVFEYLPEEEILLLNSMVGTLVEVYEVGEKYIGVTKTWRKKSGRIETHNLSVLPEDISFHQPQL